MGLVQLAIAVGELLDSLQQAVVVQMLPVSVLACLKILKDASSLDSVRFLKLLLQVHDSLCLWPPGLQRCLCNLDTVAQLLVLEQQCIAGSTEFCIGSEEDSSFIQAQVLGHLLEKSGRLYDLQGVPELLILMAELRIAVYVAAKGYRPL